MKRREFIAAFSGAAIVWRLSSAYADPVPLLGVLLPWSEGDPAAVGYVKALRDGLAGLGWREGENFTCIAMKPVRVPRAQRSRPGNWRSKAFPTRSSPTMPPGT